MFPLFSYKFHGPKVPWSPDVVEKLEQRAISEDVKHCKLAWTEVLIIFACDCSSDNYRIKICNELYFWYRCFTWPLPLLTLASSPGTARGTLDTFFFCPSTYLSPCGCQYVAGQSRPATAAWSACMTLSWWERLGLAVARCHGGTLVHPMAGHQTVAGRRGQGCAQPHGWSFHTHASIIYNVLLLYGG